MSKPINEQWPRAYRAWVKKLGRASARIRWTKPTRRQVYLEAKEIEKNVSAESAFMAGWSERGIAEGINTQDFPDA